MALTVTAVEDGKNVTATFRAKDAQDLKLQSPDAFALYDRWGMSGNQMNPLVRGADQPSQAPLSGRSKRQRMPSSVKPKLVRVPRS